MAKKKTSRIYWRDQGGTNRAYIDLRDLGGCREALKAPGEKRGTTDSDIAADLAAKRVKELEDQKRRKVILGVERVEGLKSFVAQHLLQKAKAGKVAARWLEQTQRQLETAIDFFGSDRDVLRGGVQLNPPERDDNMSEPFLGEICIAGFNFAPRGWAFCDGQILPINQNQSLYAILGTTYGGDGRSTLGCKQITEEATVAGAGRRDHQHIAGLTLLDRDMNHPVISGRHLTGYGASRSKNRSKNGS